MRPFAPPKAVPRQTRPVTSWNGRVEISAPAGATPMITLETAHLSERLRDACQAAYDRWIGLLADHLTTRGLPAERARSLASVTLSTLEGSLAMAKAARDGSIVTTAATELNALLP